MQNNNEIKPTHGVGGARRALQLLLSFTPESPRHSASKLAETLGVPVESIYCHTALFRELGMIEETPSGQLQLTPRILPAAQAAMSVQSAVAVAEPFLHRLATQVEETVLLNRLAGDVAVCLVSIPSPRPLRLEHALGHTMQLGSGATAKVLLALMSQGEREQRISMLPRTHRPSAADLINVMERGWAESFGEIDEGAWACAAGIALEGQSPMTVTVVGPSFRLDDARRREIISLASGTAASIMDRWVER